MSVETIKLGDASYTSSGGTPQRGNKLFFGGDIPWVKSGELPDGQITSTEERLTELGLEKSAAKVFDKGTLLIAMYGATVGKLGILGLPAATNQAICAIVPNSKLDSRYLFYWLLSIRQSLIDSSFGGAQPNISQSTIRNLDVPLVPKHRQIEIARTLDDTFAAIADARSSISAQKRELINLSNAIVGQSLVKTRTRTLGTVLEEVKVGIGEGWKKYPVLGATRQGLAPARERPGKYPQRYKPVVRGTVFYNPMRIMIGSVAYVDDDDTPGITSPDYVVLRGKPGVTDSRWFYHWLRSPFGEQCISSLARGAVRERMLFNRLAEGEIELPDFPAQERASKALAAIKPMRNAIANQLKELELMPKKLLAQVFES